MGCVSDGRAHPVENVSALIDIDAVLRSIPREVSRVEAADESAAALWRLIAFWIFVFGSSAQSLSIRRLIYRRRAYRSGFSGPIDMPSSLSNENGGRSRNRSLIRSRSLLYPFPLLKGSYSHFPFLSKFLLSILFSFYALLTCRYVRCCNNYRYP